MSFATIRYAEQKKLAWDRLDQLAGKRRLTGEQCAEFVALYTSASADLAWLQAEAADPAAIDWLSQRVARARAVIAAPPTRMRAEFSAFFLERFPLVLYRARWWWLAVAVGFVAVGTALGIRVAVNEAVQQSLLSESEVRQLVDTDFERYYSENPATSFAAQVWSNNAWAAAAALVAGMIFVLPAIAILWVNAANVGVVGGIMAANDRLDLFFGLIAPHGLLELSAVFAAAAVGMRVGWALIAPGARPRAQAAAQEGRSAILVALGLVAVLAISGVIEAFVTPSGLPTWARIAIGVAAWALFVGYALFLGKRAEETGVATDQSVMTFDGYPPYSG